jgi:hypothetical protein
MHLPLGAVTGVSDGSPTRSKHLGQTSAHPGDGIQGRFPLSSNVEVPHVGPSFIFRAQTELSARLRQNSVISLEVNASPTCPVASDHVGTRLHPVVRSDDAV